MSEATVVRKPAGGRKAVIAVPLTIFHVVHTKRRDLRA